jgi:monofunctional glycosyltransferase
MGNIAEKTPPSARVNKRSWARRIWTWTWKGTLGFLAFSIGLVLLYRWVNPPVTFLQLSERWSAAEGCVYSQTWADDADISLYMKLAVVASEDNNFMKHNGLDWGAIEKARKYNEANKDKKNKKMRGASTISQQTAKNVFLWPSRSWIRKGFEVYFTLLIEWLWPKERIMEVYLNVIEMGPCTFGVQAAAEKYFSTTASRLTREQAALIAACLPLPKKMNPGKPSAYLKKRQTQITRLMRMIGENYFERYSGKMDKKQAEEQEKAVEKEIDRLSPAELPASNPPEMVEEEDANQVTAPPTEPATINQTPADTSAIE